MTDEHANRMGYVSYEEFVKISKDIKSYEASLRPSQNRTLKFYTDKTKLVSTINSFDMIYFGNHSDIRFQTVNECEIAIENKIHQNLISHYGVNYSHVDIFFGSYFACRRFIVNGLITPFVSLEPNINKDKIIDKKLVRLKPFLDLKKEKIKELMKIYIDNDNTPANII